MKYLHGEVNSEGAHQNGKSFEAPQSAGISSVLSTFLEGEAR